MRSKSLSKIALGAAVSTAVMMAGTSAFAAGRCGGVYPIDTATTLAHVAQRCHVNLSALYEANPGIDPTDVRPGARIAIPSEINRYTIGATYTAPVQANDDKLTPAQSYVAPVRYDPPMQSSEYDLLDRKGARDIDHTYVREMRVPGKPPSWMQSGTESVDGTMSGGGGRYLINDRMSYQKQSAMRIHRAGVPTLTPSIMNAPSTPALKTSLIECKDLRTRDGRKIHQVRKIITTPENTFVEVVEAADGNGVDCTLISKIPHQDNSQGVLPARFTSPTKLSPPDYHLPDYSRIGVTPRMIKINETFSLKGEVADSYGDCLLLKTSDNRLWHLSSPQAPSDLVGKTVTVWGKSTASGTCGGGATMVVSHAIYAEPWAGN